MVVVKNVAYNHLEALLKVSMALTGSLKLTDVLQTAIDGAVDVLSLNTGAIYLFEQDELLLGATIPPLPPGFPDEYCRARLNDHPHIQQCLLSGETVFIQDCQLEEFTSEERGVVEARGLKSVLYVPIAADDDSIGVFIVGTTAETSTFKPIDVKLCRTLSYQVALAITNSRLYESVQIANVQLEKTQARLEDAQIVAKIGSWEWDVTVDTLWWSDEMYSIFGLSLGKDKPSHGRFMELVHPDDRMDLSKTIEDALGPAGFGSMEYRIVRPDGGERYIYAKANVVNDSEGRPLRVTGISQDITDRMRVQEALTKSSQLAAVGQIASGIAHEINNPLATIAACTEVLRERVPHIDDESDRREKRAEYLSLIDEEVCRAALIIEDLLDFARVRPMDLRPVELSELIESTVNLMRIQSKYSGYNFEVSTDCDLPLIVSDRERVRQVLIVLLSNALESMPSGGVVKVACRNDDGGGQVEFSVSDDGVGIREEDLGKLFQPFFTTKTMDKGTGLGLSIAHTIVSNHGGEILVDSILGKGSTFTVRLPRNVKQVEEKKDK